MKDRNAVLELLRARYATRSLSEEPVAHDVVLRLIESAGLAPSCYNMQPWRYLFALSERGRARVAECLDPGNRKWAAKAPLLVVGYARKDDDCVTADGRAYYQFDLGMSVMNLMLAATAEGLVARPMAGFDPSCLRLAFELDPEDEPFVVLAIGKPKAGDAMGKPRQRKPWEEIVRFV